MQTVSALQRLATLDLILPPTPTPAAHYVPWVVNNGIVYSAGQTPKEGTALKYQGQLGKDLTTQQGYDAARLCALRLLSVLHEAAEGLDNIERILKLTVFVNAGPDFTEHPQVANGASDLLHDVLGDAGVHVRSAVGASSLPGNAAVEVELIAQVS
jgi:enamine deaminase RidA (YjgF/YER057c/UK114 family)